MQKQATTESSADTIWMVFLSWVDYDIWSISLPLS